MAMLYVIQAGRTEWSEQTRIDSTVGVPLSPAGASATREIATELAGRNITAIYGSHNESDRQTAQIVADVLSVRPHASEDLRELDYGLWQGLRIEDIKHRHTRVYRQWLEAPMTICPPEGEALHEAQGRVVAAIEKIVRRHRDQNVLAVLHPLVAGLLRCRLIGINLSNIWENVNWMGTWVSYDLLRLAGAKEETP